MTTRKDNYDRAGTATQWSLVNPVLAVREVGWETDTGLCKIGDGKTAWTSLPYAGAPAPANPASGQYLFLHSSTAAATSGTLGTGSLRLSPILVTRTLSITRIGAEVTTIGDVGSKYRLGIYADNGSCLPGTLVVDAGQIAGDSATVQELTVSVTLQPGIYWVGGAVQTVTTTQPTLRTTSGWNPPIPIPLGTSIPGAGTLAVGLLQGSVTGALPGTFSLTSTTGAVPRIFVKAA